MADENRGADPALKDDLVSDCEQFDFFQATRLLLLCAQRQAGHAQPESMGIGTDVTPDKEPVRFRTAATLGFPASEVDAVRLSDRPEREPSELATTVMGLVGPHGVLPTHYTATLIEQSLAERHDRPCALRDFLDMFQHRALSFFYRSWQKYRLEVGRESAQRVAAASAHPDLQRDPMTHLLSCLAGTGSFSLSARMPVEEETPIYYVGHFVGSSRVDLQACKLEYSIVSPK